MPSLLSSSTIADQSTAFDALPADWIPLDDLVHTIRCGEQLRLRDLQRCRNEVLLQLALAPPWNGGPEQSEETFALALR